MSITKVQRNSNLEILRIISMLFIIAHHFSVHGFAEVNFVISNMNNYVIYFFGILGKIGVDVFIIISAYFMINSKFTLRKLFILGGEVYFYSITSLIIFSLFLTPATPITIDQIGLSLLPISQGVYWFVTDYITLMLISPFLNKFIKKLSKNTYLKILVLLLIIWSIYPNLNRISFGYSYMAWFVVLYLIGSFIRLHLDIDKINYKKLLIIFSISLLIIYASSILMGYLSIIFDIQSLISVERDFNLAYLFFATEKSIFVLINSVALFLIFLKRKAFYNKYINYIAGSVLGAYLIHENIFIKPYLWKKLLNISSHYYSPNLILLALFSTITIFFVCIGIDIIRRETIEKLWIWIIDNKLNIISNWAYNKYNLFINKFKYYLKE